MFTVEDSKEKVIEAMKLGARDYIIRSLSKNSFQGKAKFLFKYQVFSNTYTK
jgi:PleD family two-component response regulator